MALVKSIETPTDGRILNLFVKSIETLGGMRAIVEQQRLAMLPELLESAYVLVMQEDEHKTPEQIADLLGTSMDTVENILSAPVDTAMERARATLPGDTAGRESVAGGVARLAYNNLRTEAHHPT